MIRLHIERLIVEGSPMTSRQRWELQAAVESELARLFSTGGLNPELRGGGAVERVRGGRARLAPEKGPRHAGVEIARAVHHGIGSQGSKG